ncbi:MAG: tRNA pseudouridine(55) synthase TruB [Phycisphaerales bacterium]|nr:tRNA pseudouridine(55) synthase TruB [Phycisphaerales bacterium]
MTEQPGQAVPTPAGLLLIDKPEGPTSMDVCRRVRRRLIAGGAPKRVKVGHGGTLDPLATGLLVVLIGKATRLCDQVMRSRKVYLTQIDFSCFTITDDREGARLEVEVGSPPSAERVAAACANFVGVIQQEPPAFSAMKIGGKRAYKLARAGETPKLAARPVEIHAIQMLEYAWPLLSIEVACGKGTYIRALARDLGRALGTGGSLMSLRRTVAEPFDVREAVKLDLLPDVLGQADLMSPPGDLRFTS